MSEGMNAQQKFLMLKKRQYFTRNRMQSQKNIQNKITTPICNWTWLLLV